MSLQIFATATDDSVGANGDYALVLSQRMYVGPKAGNSWAGVARYSSVGPSGPGVVFGKGAPSSGTGADGQVYIDTSTFNAYGPKASGAWGGIANSLVGATGSPGATGTPGTQFYFDSAEPGIQLGVIGDYFFRTDTSNLYRKITNAIAATTADYPNGWKIIGSLKGSTGATGAPGAVGASGSNGLSVLSGSGAPASSLGVQGQPAYIDTAAGALYGPKGASAWPSPISLQGPQGQVGASGPAGAVIYSGSGAPSGTNPSGTITAGSFYIQTDTQPNRLFGPYTAANGWPSAFASMGGGSLLTSNGPPANATGNIGDCAVDVVNGFFYPGKTASGWTTTPINMTGPIGPAGVTTLPNATYVPGMLMAVPSQAVTSTPYVVTLPNSTMPFSYVPQFASAFMGLGYTCGGTACTVELYNQTTSTSVYSVALTANKNATIGPFTNTQYPLTAGNTYVWRLTGSGTVSLMLSPFWLTPSSIAASAICPISPLCTPPSTGFSTTATTMFPPGITSGQGGAQYMMRAGSIVGGVAYYYPSTAGAASATATINVGYVIAGTGNYTSFSKTVPNTGAAIAIGPFQPGTYPIPANGIIVCNATGSGTGQVRVDLNIIA